MQFRGVAQLVAHLVWDQGVAGSNPVTPTKKLSQRFFERVFLCVVKASVGRCGNNIENNFVNLACSSVKADAGPLNAFISAEWTKVG